jgi:hypothetical protein
MEIVSAQGNSAKRMAACLRIQQMRSFPRNGNCLQSNGCGTAEPFNHQSNPHHAMQGLNARS